MNGVEKLIRRLLRSDVRVWCERDTVRFRGSKNAIAQSDLEFLRAHKGEAVRFLRNTGLTSGELPLVEAMKRTASLPASLTQQRLWFLSQLEATGSSYHMAGGVRLRGKLDRAALRRALDRIVDRHDILRTTFAEVDGEVMQVIASPGRGMPLREDDLSSAVDASERLQALIVREREAPFDLREGPLIRARLVRLGESENVLLLATHHIVSDGWSIGVLSNELSALYGAYVSGEDDPLPKLPIQYADYAVWQRRWLQGDRLQRQARYWQERLGQAPGLLELPTDHARPPIRSHAGASVPVSLDAALTGALQALARRHEATVFMTLLTGWALLLSRLSGQEEVVVGMPIANRTRAELEKMIGFFVNTLALRLDISGTPTVAELLARVKREVLNGQSHADIPFEDVVQQIKPVRSLSHSPLFQVMLVWRSVTSSASAVHWPGLSLHALSAPVSAEQVDMTLSLEPTEDGSGIEGKLSYATALFERSTVERYLGYWTTLLRAIAVDDNQKVHHLEKMQKAERDQLLVQWNATQASYPRELCVHELFEEQVRQSPDELALVCGSGRLSYRELNRRADALALSLREKGVRPDSRVGICLERDVSLAVGMLAVLKAGGAYVALDPNYPAQRLLYMLEDAAPLVVLTQPDLSSRLPDMSATVLLVDVEGQVLEEPRQQTESSGDLPKLSRAPGLTSSHLAYVIYTSGSTGLPKGVMIEHGNAVNFICWSRTQFSPEELRHTVFSTSISFDLSVFELFVPLSCGGTVHLVRNVLELKEAAPVATLINTVPSAAAALLSAHQALPALQVINLAGEPLKRSLVEQLYRDTPVRRVVNLYAPSETTTYSTYATVERGSSGEPHIGRPIANTQIYILDRHGQLVPAGVVGEIYIGGAGVTRGYLNRPELTAQRFVPDSLGVRPGARLYRTGDLGRYRAGGNIEFLGRNDDQVKLRGYRIELAEIEAQLRRCASVREAAVVAREDAPGEKRLVAYVTLAGEAVTDTEDAATAKLSTGELREALRAVLPEYMIPSAFVILQSLPLTPNGKLDRRALPAPEATDSAAAYEVPQGEIEQALAEIWQKLLRVPRVGRHDNFFELGGHSLLIQRVVAQVREQFEVDVTLRTLFEAATLARCAERIGALQREAGEMRIPPLRAQKRTEYPALSFAQERLWFLDQLGMAGAAYNMPMVRSFEGVLDVEALERSFRTLIQRHESLHTHFALHEGTAYQVIEPAAASQWQLPIEDLSGLKPAERGLQLQSWLEREAQRPFDLSSGPLMRARLLRLGSSEHVLLVTMHHIISDGWSMAVLGRELQTLYEAFSHGQPSPLRPLDIQYADYAIWQRSWLQGEELTRQLRYWKKQLSAAPAALQLSADKARPPAASFKGALVPLQLSADLTAGLRVLAQREQVTLFMVLLAAFQVLLARHSGQDDIVVGAPIAGRTHPQLEGLIGFFVNMLALRADVSADPSFTQLLRQVKETALGAYAHQALPFEKLVAELQPERDLSRHPVFQVTFAFDQLQASAAQAPSELIASSSSTSKFDLTLQLTDFEAGLRGAWVYATDLFEQPTIERLAQHFQILLEGIVADPQRRLSQLPLLSEKERQQVLALWNQTTAPSAHDRSIAQLFEQQVERTGEALAVVYEDQHLTYRQLNEQANQLAHYLIEQGVRPGSRVALCAERSVSMLVGLLGILKAGGAYVPLHPSQPRERLRYMLRDSSPVMVLSSAESSGVSGADSLGIAVTDLDADRQRWARHSVENPSPAGLTSSHLAYVIYTSGSTGQPKAVMIAQRGVINLWESLGRHVYSSDFNSRRVTLNASLSFDASTKQWTRLLSGDALVVIPHALRMDAPAMLEYLRRQCVDVLDCTPTQLVRLLEEGQLGEQYAPHTVLIGGEPIGPGLWRTLAQAPRTRFINVYGPTEITVVATMAAIGHHTRIPSIGRPIDNTQVYILDRYGQPVPVGVAGEIYIGGAGVACGYLNRPGLTAQRFVPDPFTEPSPHGVYSGARLYRTGDLGRYLSDGNIEFLGRNDDQVKLRGYRIELGEIEAQLRSCAGVREAVVLAREDVPGEKRLVAYATATAGAQLQASELRDALRVVLPEYMIPSLFVMLPALPLTPSGKLDRRALPAPEGLHRVTTYEPPEGDIERALAEIWQSLLHVERVGRHDNFFELGGHSLLTVSLMTRIRGALDVRVSVASIFTSPTIAGLARLILAKSSVPGHTDAPAWLIPLRRTGNSGHAVLFMPTLFGLGSVYAGLARRLKISADILTCRLPGTAPRESPLSTIEELAAHCMATIVQPEAYQEWSLIGWSFGGVLAYELACRITQRGLRLRRVILVDSYLLAPERRVSTQPAAIDLEFARVFREAPDSSHDIDALRRVGEANLAAHAAYRGGAYSGPMVELQAAGTTRDIDAGIRPQLRAFSSPEHSRIIVPGDHYSILDPGRSAQFAQLLDDLLASA
jgi:amino acid adenylation domain-containing protein